MDKKEIRLDMEDMDNVVGGRRFKIELPRKEDLSEEDRKILERFENIKL